MASLALTISPAVVANGGAWTTFSTSLPQQQQQQQVSSCCSSTVCGIAAASAQHVSMFSQLGLQAKTPVLRQFVSRGHSLCDVASSSSRHFGAAVRADAGGATSVVVQSSTRNSAGAVEEELSSSAAGETPKKGENRSNTSNRYLIGSSEEDLQKLCMSLGAVRTSPQIQFHFWEGISFTLGILHRNIVQDW